MVTTIIKEKEISLVSFDDDIYASARKLEDEAFKELFAALKGNLVEKITIDVSIQSLPNRPLKRVVRVKLTSEDES